MLGARYMSYAEFGHQNTQNIPEVTSQNNIVFFRVHDLSNNIVLFRAHGLSLSLKVSGRNEAPGSQEKLTLVCPHGWSWSM